MVWTTASYLHQDHPHNAIILVAANQLSVRDWIIGCLYDLYAMTTSSRGDKKRVLHVGSYEVGKTLGNGSFGKVKLGTNVFTKEKVPPPPTCKDFISN